MVQTYTLSCILSLFHLSYSKYKYSQAGIHSSRSSRIDEERTIVSPLIRAFRCSSMPLTHSRQMNIHPPNPIHVALHSHSVSKHVSCTISLKTPLLCYSCHRLITAHSHLKPSGWPRRSLNYVLPRIVFHPTVLQYHPIDPSYPSPECYPLHQRRFLQKL